jgi:hypothetical protein
VEALATEASSLARGGRHFMQIALAVVLVRRADAEAAERQVGRRVVRVRPEVDVVV